LTRKIESFSPETLAHYIRRHYYTPEEEVVKKLIYHEAQLEYDQIQKKIDVIIERKTRPILDDPKKLIRAIKSTRSDSEKLDVLWKRQEELSRIMFPDYYAQKEAEK
jgi:hypothetical protein